MAVYNTNVELILDTGEDVLMPYAYPVLAIAEEAGEVCGAIAKFIRKSAGMDDAVSSVVELRNKIGKELGDLLFQVSEAARQFDFTLQEIAELNYDKLTDRKERGVIVGEGDER